MRASYELAEQMNRPHEEIVELIKDLNIGTREVLEDLVGCKIEIFELTDDEYKTVMEEIRNV